MKENSIKDLDDLRCLTVEQFCDLFGSGMCKETAHRMARNGEIQAFKLRGGKWLFPIQGVRQFIAERVSTTVGRKERDGKKLVRTKQMRFNRETKKYEWV